MSDYNSFMAHYLGILIILFCGICIPFLILDLWLDFTHPKGLPRLGEIVPTGTQDRVIIIDDNTVMVDTQ